VRVTTSGCRFEADIRVVPDNQPDARGGLSV
jgi:hypothetical protein